MSKTNMGSVQWQFTALGPLEEAYGSVLLGRRICQLYCFMLLFEPMSSLISLGYQGAAWMLITGLSQLGAMPPPSPLSLSGLTTSRDLLEILFVANIWIIFHIYSSFKPAWWSIILCVIALAHNQHAAYIGMSSANTDWAAIVGQDVGTEVFIQSILFTSGIALSHIYFLYLAIRGQQAIHGLSQSERDMLADLRSGETNITESIRALINIPAAIRYASGKIVGGIYMIFAGVANFINYWRLTVVFIFACTLPLLIAVLFPNISNTFGALSIEDQRNAALVSLGAGVVLLIIMLAILLSIPLIIKHLGRYAVRAAEKRMRTSLEKIQHEDQRPPILFLRSFANDTVPLPTGGFALSRWLLDGAGSADTLDYIVLEEGTKTGPTVALGNPDDLAPPYGVARGYFDHDSWQEAVAGLCADAAAIIFVLDETEGVRWELSHIADQNLPEKTLFLLAPGDIGRKQGNHLISRALSSACAIEQAEARELVTDQEANLMGFHIRNGSVGLLTTDKGTQYSYLIAIRRFLRQLGRVSSQTGVIEN